jgi:N-acetylneuraminate synthase
MAPGFSIGGRPVGPDHPPLVIAEIGINHEGDLGKARRMIDDAAEAGAPVVKLQCHVLEDEMIPEARGVVPGNATESIWTIMERAALSADEEAALKEHAEDQGLVFLSTPFSRAAADRLEGLGVAAYKIGSGECNNLPLVDHVASFGKPMIVSTGMNDLASVAKTVAVLERRGVPYALLHCTSMYPTPYREVRLGALGQMAKAFPRAVLGLSDHSLGNWTCFGAIPLGARILEKHFTSDPTWPGPDVPISITPRGLRDLVDGSAAIFEALGGDKTVLPGEKPTIDFAYSCVVTTASVRAGERLTKDNLWVKRPGTGEILAEHYEAMLGKVARVDLGPDRQLRWEDVRDADVAA